MISKLEALRYECSKHRRSLAERLTELCELTPLQLDAEQWRAYQPAEIVARVATAIVDTLGPEIDDLRSALATEHKARKTAELRLAFERMTVTKHTPQFHAPEWSVDGTGCITIGEPLVTVSAAVFNEVQAKAQERDAFDATIGVLRADNRELIKRAEKAESFNRRRSDEIAAARISLNNVICFARDAISKLP